MADDTPLRTVLHAWHQAHGGRMVEFGGWSMPVQYTSIIDEHQAVRNRAGLFDISHMGRLRFEGAGGLEWLQRVTTNDVSRLKPGAIQYSLVVDDDGGILDDVLVYRLTVGYLMVCNASNRLKVVDQLERHRQTDAARLRDETLDTAMIAVQGPQALNVIRNQSRIDLDALGYYHCAQGLLEGQSAAGTPALVSRTGYTGEDGFELIVPEEAAVALWETLLEQGRAVDIRPCGLGARDTLRFEAAMPLYGHEMDETVNPYEAGLGWAVKLGKGDFVGRDALRRLKSHEPARTRVGLKLAGKRIARQGSVVKRDGQPVGTVTSGTFSPTLGLSLAMALVDPPARNEGTRLVVDVRGNDEPAEVVPLPFYQRATSR